MKTYEPVEISYKQHGVNYKVEGLDWDISGEEAILQFKRLLVCAGYPPSILDEGT